MPDSRASSARAASILCMSFPATRTASCSNACCGSTTPANQGRRRAPLTRNTAPSTMGRSRACCAVPCPRIRKGARHRRCRFLRECVGMFGTIQRDAGDTCFDRVEDVGQLWPGACTEACPLDVVPGVAVDTRVLAREADDLVDRLAQRCRVLACWSDRSMLPAFGNGVAVAPCFEHLAAHVR